MERRKQEQSAKEEKQHKAYCGKPSCRLQCQEVSLGLRVIACSRGKTAHAFCLLGVVAVWDPPVCENCHYTGQNSCKLTVCAVSIQAHNRGVTGLEHHIHVRLLIT